MKPFKWGLCFSLALMSFGVFALELPNQLGTLTPLEANVFARNVIVQQALGGGVVSQSRFHIKTHPNKNIDKEELRGALRDALIDGTYPVQKIALLITYITNPIAQRIIFREKFRNLIGTPNSGSWASGLSETKALIQTDLDGFFQSAAEEQWYLEANSGERFRADNTYNDNLRLVVGRLLGSLLGGQGNSIDVRGGDDIVVVNSWPRVAQNRQISAALNSLALNPNVSPMITASLILYAQELGVILREPEVKAKNPRVGALGTRIRTESVGWEFYCNGVASFYVNELNQFQRNMNELNAFYGALRDGGPF